MIYRIEIVPNSQADPAGTAAANEIRVLGIDAVKSVSAGRVFLIEADEATLPRAAAERIAAELLADPVVERFHISFSRDTKSPPQAGTQGERGCQRQRGGQSPGRKRGRSPHHRGVPQDRA